MNMVGYINLYVDHEGFVVCTGVYSSKEAARHCASDYGYIDTVQINWKNK